MTVGVRENIVVRTSLSVTPCERWLLFAYADSDASQEPSVLIVYRAEPVRKNERKHDERRKDIFCVEIRSNFFNPCAACRDFFEVDESNLIMAKSSKQGRLRTSVDSRVSHCRCTWYASHRTHSTSQVTSSPFEVCPEQTIYQSNCWTPAHSDRGSHSSTTLPSFGKALDDSSSLLICWGDVGRQHQWSSSP